MARERIGFRQTVAADRSRRLRSFAARVVGSIDIVRSRLARRDVNRVAAPGFEDLAQAENALFEDIRTEPPLSISTPLPTSNVFVPEPPKKSSSPVVLTKRFAPEPAHATVWRPVSFSNACAPETLLTS